MRGLVLGKLGKAGHKPTLEEARRRFKDHVEGKQILPADLRSPVRKIINLSVLRSFILVRTIDSDCFPPLRFI